MLSVRRKSQIAITLVAQLNSREREGFAEVGPSLLSG
jgi:hypothetical protein